MPTSLVTPAPWLGGSCSLTFPFLYTLSAILSVPVKCATAAVMVSVNADSYNKTLHHIRGSSFIVCIIVYVFFCVVSKYIPEHLLVRAYLSISSVLMTVCTRSWFALAALYIQLFCVIVHSQVCMLECVYACKKKKACLHSSAYMPLLIPFWVCGLSLLAWLEMTVGPVRACVSGYL